MDKWEGYIKFASILLISIFLDLVIFGPLIADAVELGLNAEITLVGVNAPAEDLLEPTFLIFYRSIWRILDIGGSFSIIFSVLKKIHII